ncbi:MAG: class I SAM-dependent methyltransferase [Bacteroidales bacterium]|nr:class I SAM-dependent methyltransferase [Bacteroidales bacterium]
MNIKILAGLRALKLIIKFPYLLNLVLDSEDVFQKKVSKKYGLDEGLPLLRLEELFPDFTETVSPYAYLSGATMPIDIALLKMLARRRNVQRYFEIGTWRGESVANVAAVVPQCVTLNLSREEIIKLTDNERYADAHAFFSKNLDNVTHIEGNSQSFDFTPYKGQFDMVFIDGDHHSDAVKKDTQTAFELLRDEKSIIVWHDYGYDPETIRWSVLYAIWEGTPEEKRKHLYHVANTMCAVYLPEELPVGTLVPHALPEHYYEVTLKTVGL